MPDDPHDLQGRDVNEIAVTLHMPRDELMALSQFVKRVDFDTCAHFASRTTYDGAPEADTMWSAMCMLRAQLAEAGFSPR